MKKSELRKIIKEEITNQVKNDVISLLKSYDGKNVPDEKMHAIADKYGISPHDLESFVYSLASKYVVANETNMWSGDNVNYRLQESFKIKGHIYDLVPAGESKAYIGSDGILGHKDYLIPWDDVLRYLKKYKKTKVTEMNESSDIITKGIKAFFKKLRDARNKKEIEKIKKDDPDLAKSLDYLASNQEKIDNILSKVTGLDN